MRREEVMCWRLDECVLFGVGEEEKLLVKSVTEARNQQRGASKVQKEDSYALHNNRDVCFKKCIIKQFHYVNMREWLTKP